MRITLSDITGRIAGNTISVATSKGANDIAYPVAGLPAGLYLLHVADGTRRVVRKVVVR